MRVLDLGAVYFALGLVLLVAVMRRARRSPLDAALLVLLWPMYLPVLLAEGAPAVTRKPSPFGPIRDEHEEMRRALASVGDETIARLLPTPLHVDRLFEHLTSLDAKVQELTEVLAKDELDLGRATRAVREAEAEGGVAQKHAESVLSSVRRLLSLRDRALRERDELLSLSRRLRLAVTVLRFSGGTEEDVGGIVAEIVGRVEGVREAFSEA